MQIFAKKNRNYVLFCLFLGDGPVMVLCKCRIFPYTKRNNPARMRGC